MFDDARLRRRPAHVEREHVLDPLASTKVRGKDRPGRRSGLEDADRNRVAVSVVARPPEESMTNRGAVTPRARSPSRRRAIYRATTGPTYAFAAVVDVRSNSRISGETSAEMETKTAGSADDTAAAAAASWASFA